MEFIKSATHSVSCGTCGYSKGLPCSSLDDGPTFAAIVRLSAEPWKSTIKSYFFDADLAQVDLHVPKRLLFRMTYYQNLKQFLDDGAEFAKDSPLGRPRYRVSFEEIVARRGTILSVPSGQTVNAFVPFYFSPSTKMAYSIHMGNVPLRAPDDRNLGPADMEDVAFMVVDPRTLLMSGRECWFTDQACNSAIAPQYERDPSKLAQHIAWHLFDEGPRMAIIPEVGYEGVCKWQHDRDVPPYQQRSKMRMAEFLVSDHLSMDEVLCIVLKSNKHLEEVTAWVAQSGLKIPVLVKSGCYF